MSLIGHMRVRKGGIHRSFETPSTSCTTAMPSPIPTPSPSEPTISSSATLTKTDIYTADFSRPHCPRAFTSAIGLVGHLRIHRTETGESVPGAPTHTRRIRLSCSHCTRTSSQLMGLLGHMRNSRKPAVDNRRLLHTTTSSPINTCITHQHHQPQTSSCHLPRKWEVCASAPSPSDPSAALYVKRCGLEDC
ncbi:hypothetical protein SprV_0401657400 [Sparganum proliferum]